MRRFAARAALVLCALACAGCHRGMVRLETMPGSGTYEWRDPLTAEGFRKPCAELPYEIETPVGYAQARKDPLVGFAVNARMQWNDTVKPVLIHFDDLCKRYNAALVTLSEFDAREGELVGAALDLSTWREALSAALLKYEGAQEVQQTAEREGAEATDETRRAATDMDAAKESVEGLIKRATTLVAGLGPVAAPPEQPT